MRFGPAIPILRIFDEAKAAEFYVGFLGFTKEWEHRFGDNFPLYMQVSKGGCVLHLSGHHGDCCPGAAVRIETPGVRDFCQELTAKDYRHAKPECEPTEYNTLEMRVSDPFGNKLIFYEKLESCGEDGSGNTNVDDE